MQSHHPTGRTVRRKARLVRDVDEHGNPVCRVEQEEVSVFYPDTGRVDQLEIAHGEFVCGCDRFANQKAAVCASCARAFCRSCPKAGWCKDGKPRCDGCSRETVDRFGRVQRLSHEQFDQWRFAKRVRRVGLVLLSPFLAHRGVR